MSDLTTAKENAMTAIDMLKESVLTALVELGAVDEYISANDVTVWLGLEGIKKENLEVLWDLTKLLMLCFGYLHAMNVMLREMKENPLGK